MVIMAYGTIQQPKHHYHVNTLITYSYTTNNNPINRCSMSMSTAAFFSPI